MCLSYSNGCVKKVDFVDPMVQFTPEMFFSIIRENEWKREDQMFTKIVSNEDKAHMSNYLYGLFLAQTV